MPTSQQALFNFSLGRRRRRGRGSNLECASHLNVIVSFALHRRRRRRAAAAADQTESVLVLGIPKKCN